MVHDSYLDQVVARVETKMLLRGLAPHTVATYIPCVRRFIGWVGKPLGAVKSRDVEQPSTGQSAAAPSTGALAGSTDGRSTSTS
jgi:hypothetical protein